MSVNSATIDAQQRNIDAAKTRAEKATIASCCLMTRAFFSPLVRAFLCLEVTSSPLRIASTGRERGPWRWGLVHRNDSNQ
jgi:hypothetical protein